MLNLVRYVVSWVCFRLFSSFFLFKIFFFIIPVSCYGYLKTLQNLVHSMLLCSFVAFIVHVIVSVFETRLVLSLCTL